MALFPCSNLSSDGKLEDLGYFHLMWTSWSSLLQQQQRALGVLSTHSQALGTAARYQGLTHPCAAHIHSCCSEISASMHQRAVVTVRIYLLLAHACLIFLSGLLSQNGWDWQGPLEVISSGPLLKQGYLVAQVAHTAFEMSSRKETPQPHCSTGQSLDKEVTQVTFVTGAVPPQVQDLALHEVSLSPFPQPYCTVICEVNCYRIIYLH